MNSFDIDGVIYLGPDRTGIWPGPDDVIITGRSFEEREVTFEMLAQRNIFNEVFFNPRKISEKTRESSGQHKADTFDKLRLLHGKIIDIHYEDDKIQAEVIRQLCPWVWVAMVDTLGMVEL